MTREKLKSVATENAKVRYGYINEYYIEGYVDGAKPREEQIAEAKELLQDILEWFVYPLEQYNFTDEDRKHLKRAKDFLEEEH